VEAFATWATVLVAEAVAAIGAIGEAVVTCGHEVPHGTGVIEPRNPGARRSRRPSAGARVTAYDTPEGLDTPLRKRPPKRGRLVGRSWI
jgi:hypothetical protein